MATYMDGMDGGKHNSDNTEARPMKKQKYSITAHSPATQIWYYEVEAESEEIAMHLVMSGEIDAIDYRVEGDWHADAEYEVTDVEDAEEDNNA